MKTNKLEINLVSAFNALSPEQLGDFKFLVDKIQRYEQNEQQNQEECKCIVCRLQQIIENEEIPNVYKIKTIKINPNDLFGGLPNSNLF